MNDLTTFTTLDGWFKAIFMKYPAAKIHEERVKSGGFCKVAFVGRELVGKYRIGSSGWIVP
jgi:hypothetical protein